MVTDPSPSLDPVPVTRPLEQIAETGAAETELRDLDLSEPKAAAGERIHACAPLSRGMAPACLAAGRSAGVYPMLADETCWFLAVDFDRKSWMQDVAAFRDTTRAKGVPVAIERSRSGNGAHAWIFFAEPVPAAAARRLGALLVTATSGNGVRGTESLQTPRWREQDSNSPSPWCRAVVSNARTALREADGRCLA